MHDRATAHAATPSPRRALWLGALGLASAMGIGRFAFTPLLPLMQERFGLSLAQGGMLASINYIGYLVGALLCVAFDPPPGLAARAGLAAVAVSTLAMAVLPWFGWWAMWRLVAGIASAYVLVGVASWTMSTLAALGRVSGSGWIFVGVGSGIALAGVVGLLSGAAGLGPTPAWAALGLGAAAICWTSWRVYNDRGLAPASAVPSAGRRLGAEGWRLILCYGVFGFGYIIPATFLPSMARELVPDPAVFGWAWPVFGAAAAVSVAAVAGRLSHLPPRRIWIVSQWLMAFGVALPALHASLTTVIVSAVAVGGSFVVLTMAALQEGRRIAGASATRLMAAMTAAFAIGQLLGPLTISASADGADALRVPSLVGAALLALSALVLPLRAPRAAR